MHDEARPGAHTFRAPVVLYTKEAAMNERETKNLVTEAKEYVVQTIRGVGDVAGAIVDATSSALARALEGTRATGSELRALIADTITGTVQGVAQVGGEVESAASSIMIGALRGAKQVGKTGIEAVSATAATLVKEAAELGGDVGRTARSAVASGLVREARS